MLAVGLRTFEALYMITVFEGFMIISGAISGNIVLDEKAGQPPHVLGLYFASICIILVGLYVLCRGEKRPTHDSIRMLDGVALAEAAKEQVEAFDAVSFRRPSIDAESSSSATGGAEPPAAAPKAESRNGGGGVEGGGESNGHDPHSSVP